MSDVGRTKWPHKVWLDGQVYRPSGVSELRPLVSTPDGGAVDVVPAEQLRGAVVALREIAARPVVERNPDGVDQAAHTMRLIALEALVALGEARPQPDAAITYGAAEALVKIHHLAKYLAEPAWTEEGCRLVARQIVRLAAPHLRETLETEPDPSSSGQRPSTEPLTEEGNADGS